MTKVKFEAELDPKLKNEIESWGFSVEDLVKEGLEHSLQGALKRKTDNLCRRCIKPIRASIPPKDRNMDKYPQGFCQCG
jgi:hypothetical protein